MPNSILHVAAAMMFSALSANPAIADENWTSAEVVSRCQALLHAADGTPGKAMCVNTVGADSAMGTCMTPNPYQEDYAAIVDWLANNPKDGEDETVGIARAEQALYGCK